MDLATVVEAALKLGVIPALLLFLVVSLHLQNRQLLRDRKEIEIQLLKTMGRIVADYQLLLRATGAAGQQKTQRRSRDSED